MSLTVPLILDTLIPQSAAPVLRNAFVAEGALSAPNPTVSLTIAKLTNYTSFQIPDVLNVTTRQCPAPSMYFIDTSGERNFYIDISLPSLPLSLYSPSIINVASAYQFLLSTCMNRIATTTYPIGTVFLQTWNQGLEIGLTTIPTDRSETNKTYISYSLSQTTLASAKINRLSTNGLPTTNIVATFGTAPTPTITDTPDTDPPSGAGVRTLTYPPLYGIQIDGVLIYVANQADENTLYTWLTQNLP